MTTEAPTRPLGRVARTPAAVESGSRRSEVKPGSLLAVCGLAGGTGTTTIVYLVALAAARALREPVLVADTGGPSALSEIAGAQAPRSLPELASQLATGLPVKEGIYASGRDGVRVLASAPEFNATAPTRLLQRILADAREAHRLTVIDCGILARDADRATASAATHLAWVMRANERGMRHATRILNVAPRFDARELLVARNDPRQSKPPLKQLRRIAAERNAALILLPHLDALECGSVDRALEEAQVSIQAIIGATLR
jgi:MinD-like ATPase involved in chromosome partitioning or flagellar assembly